MQGPLVAAADRGEVYDTVALLTDKPPQGAGSRPSAVNVFVAAGVPGRMHAYVAVSVLPALPLPEWAPGDPVADTDGAPDRSRRGHSIPGPPVAAAVSGLTCWSLPVRWSAWLLPGHCLLTCTVY